MKLALFCSKTKEGEKTVSDAGLLIPGLQSKKNWQKELLCEVHSSKNFKRGYYCQPKGQIDK